MRLTIRSHACVDSFGREFIITVPHPERDALDLPYWTQQAGGILAGLKLRRDAASVQPVLDFLSSLPAQPMRDGKVVVCNDAREPEEDGDCSWESGGRRQFSIELIGADNAIHVSEDFSG